MNLLVNAVQAIEKDGLITVRTRQIDDNVLVQINDNGRGIYRESQSQIFDPFFIEKGTGMGLS